MLFLLAKLSDSGNPKQSTTNEQAPQNWRKPQEAQTEYQASVNDDRQQRRTYTQPKENEIWEMLKQTASKPNSLDSLHPITNSRNDVQFQSNIKPMILNNTKMDHQQKAAINNNLEQFRKINVEDLFKVDTVKLPQPPPNWRTKMAPESVRPSKQEIKTENMDMQQKSIPFSQFMFPLPDTQLPENLPLSQKSPAGGSAVTKKSTDFIYHPLPQNVLMPTIFGQQNGSSASGSHATKKSYQTTQYFYNQVNFELHLS